MQEKMSPLFLKSLPQVIKIFIALLIWALVFYKYHYLNCISYIFCALKWVLSKTAFLSRLMSVWARTEGNCALSAIKVTGPIRWVVKTSVQTLEGQAIVASNLIRSVVRHRADTSITQERIKSRVLSLLRVGSMYRLSETKRINNCQKGFTWRVKGRVYVNIEVPAAINQNPVISCIIRFPA